MSKSAWYATLHLHSYGVSVFRTSDYDGRGGCDTELAATYRGLDLLNNQIEQAKADSYRKSKDLAFNLESTKHDHSEICYLMAEANRIAGNLQVMSKCMIEAIKFEKRIKELEGVDL